MKDSLCKTCVYGHCMEGKIIHRSARIDGGDADTFIEGLPDMDDYLDEEEESDGFSDEPTIKIKEQLLKTTTSLCYFPHIPKTAPSSFEAYAFTDGIVEVCNRFKGMKV